jgi:ribokinase
VQGANDLLTVEHVQAARAHIAASAVLCCQLEVPFTVNLEAMRIAKENNGARRLIALIKRTSRFSVTTVFNPAPGIPDLPVELLTNADIVCPNENEAEMLSLSAVGSLRTVDDARRMADIIQQRARTVRAPNMPAPTVIVTLGARGCMLMASDGSAQHVECPRVTPVDTTVSLCVCTRIN